jgi:FtsH-binding integral membrane protein
VRSLVDARDQGADQCPHGRDAGTPRASLGHLMNALGHAESIPLTRDQSRAVFGQVMGFVALTLGCLALGAYIGRDLSGGWGILAFIAGFACVFGLNVASSRGNEQVAITLLFGLGLLLGLALGPMLSEYVEADPAAVWQAAGATGGFVAALGAVGYATRRDLSSWYRLLFWALLGLIVFGVVAIFVSIPAENLIWSVAGLVIFGGYTVLDFNRLRRAGQESAVPIAASIFLDVLNIFLFFLQLFGGNSE